MELKNLMQMGKFFSENRLIQDIHPGKSTSEEAHSFVSNAKRFESKYKEVSAAMKENLVDPIFSIEELLMLRPHSIFRAVPAVILSALSNLNAS